MDYRTVLDLYRTVLGVTCIAERSHRVLVVVVVAGGLAVT